MRVCRTPNNEKPEAKQIRKLLQQDSTFFFAAVCCCFVLRQPTCLQNGMKCERESKLKKQ